jgi:tetratricopeptide (TPR) repeat protein
MVISRTSAKCYQNTHKPVPQIARELNVDVVVEGSVLRAEDRVRITLQLVEGRMDRHLWSQSYERDLRDVLALQREVAQAVAGEIQTVMNPAEPGRSELVARPEGTQHPTSKAYDTFLKGRYHFARYGEGESLETAIHYFEQAISEDPTFALAHAGLANALLIVAWLSQDKLASAREAAERAIAVDPLLPEGHAALGFALNLEWNWQRSEAEYKRAIELDPNSSTAHQWYAQLLRDMMRYDEALREAQRAHELDPLSLNAFTMVGWVFYNQHRYDEAVALWNEVLKLDPNYGLAIYNKGLVYAMKGMGDKVLSTAHEVALHWGGIEGKLLSSYLLCAGYGLTGQSDRAKQVLAELEAQHFPPSVTAELLLILGEKETALDWLEKAYEQRSSVLSNTMSEPVCDPIRDHPRFLALQKKIGLA